MLPTLAMLTGCLPIPWTEYQQPAIIGYLESDGHPLPSVTVVTLSESAPDCSGALARVVTDSVGRFYLPARTHQWRFVSLMERGQVWGLCAAIGGRDVSMTLTAHYGMRMVRSADLRCQIFRVNDMAATLRGACDVRERK